MTHPIAAPCGSWKSPITSDLIVSEHVPLLGLIQDGDDLYWIESRPREAGRNVLVRHAGRGQRDDITPPPFNARTRVHEYGGAAVLVDRGAVYFSNYADQRLYRQRPGEAPEAITPDAPLRYADGVIDHARDRGIWVLEDHGAGGGEAVNSIAAVPLAGGAPEVLVSGNDFYSTPRLSTDGSKLAWLAWDHPNMPWNGCELWVADVAGDGELRRQRRIAGGADESVFQPEWSPDGRLYFVSDRSGWWNIHRQRDDAIESLVEMQAEFGLPQWVFGSSTYAFESAERIVCTYCRRGQWRLATIDTATGRLEDIATGYSSFSSISAANGFVTMLAASPTEPRSLVRLDLASGDSEVLVRSSAVAIDPAYVSVAEAIEFPTEDGATAHAFYYPPANPRYVPTAGELPPLIVQSHGGPTGATGDSLSLGTQFWTSRGFGVLDVNYRGSTGYGRAYRARLDGMWGVADVDDCVNGARYLVERGLVDGERLAITGGSAGGYTTLCALTFRDVFKVGASYYGVSDCEALARETHKFESRYLDRLIGPYPERRDLYLERSPIRHTDRLSCPLIFFQGLEDEIVPPNQAETMVEALRAKGLPVAYLAFEAEQHGFRQADNIKRSLEAELYFYSRIFGFQPADEIKPVHIDNL